MLEHAGHPLSDAQINFLSELAPGPEFTRRMTEVLTDLQIRSDQHHRETEVEIAGIDTVPGHLESNEITCKIKVFAE
jgi:hypothetical protein